MENLPFFISALFILATASTLFFLYRAFHRSKLIAILSLAWLTVQAIIAKTGFYQQTQTKPPHFLLLVLPPILLIIALFISARGRRFLDSANVTWLVVLHIVRIPVELTLLALFLQHQVPQLMTFEGRNWDILSGLSTPFIAYFGYMKLKLNRTVLLTWNIICLCLLFNIVINAILSVPTPFQKFAFDQPNVAILYFPFVWLPCFIVPAVLFSHLVAIRQLSVRRKQTAATNVFIGVTSQIAITQQAEQYLK